MNEVAKTTERSEYPCWLTGVSPTLSEPVLIDIASKKRNTPVDLTGDDEDDDLRKAMQASLESESTRQKRQQEYGYDPRSGGRAVSGLENDFEGCAEGQRGVRSKGSKAVDDDDAVMDTEDGEWTMCTAPRRAKATYKRSKGGRRSCSRIKESEEEDDAMEVDGKSESGADKVCSASPPQEEVGASGRYGLRNRSALRKPTDVLSESLASTVALKEPRKKRTTSKKKKVVEEEAWWERANSVRIISRIFASLTSVSWLFCL
jgi:hypothetical protein